ncbi:glycoside hydrolase family 2 TIM barrel-domain containing protein [Mucilaginibacter sp. PAMB04274]|uniref:glycoside hydrolase family 2 TIM barrel-domain containing protein n=1 Tax=Mucilaginibacter sp. PAMB04274 TaxID=3138568 RepID=UPI0031F66B5B
MGSDTLFYEPQFDIKDWASIKVPGNWELQGFAEPFYARNLKKGMGLYRTTFKVPTDWKGNPTFIALDGVEFGYSIWVNGKFAGKFASAYNRNVFDISEFATIGVNQLAVKVITQPKGYEFDTNDDWSISGISRNVTVFSLPKVHLRDVVIKTAVSAGTAVEVQALVEKAGNLPFPKDLKLTGKLTDASGRTIKSVDLQAEANPKDAAVLSYKGRIAVTGARLWSAESPYLYTIQIAVRKKAGLIQEYQERVGIRELSWADGVLKLNGAPIKLKGANHHDLSPVNGRAISKIEMVNDLNLMRKANINFIRTSHYPPAYPFLELCDSLGFYVMDEIPYGFGEQHLKDTSYLPILLQRAKSTIARDKNHPSVIIWTSGNENPITEIGLKTGKYIKRSDNTRPYSFPQTPDVFEDMLKAIPDSIDMLNDHYPTKDDLKRFAPKLDRPMISGEYAHALGLDFNSMEAVHETMYPDKHMVGGAVWAFFDQGLLRRSPKPFNKNEFTFYVWPTRDSIFDTSTNEGADGIVYANRVPQVDYYQVRKVYTPVKILDDTLKYQAGKATYKLRIENRYDFTNLSATQCEWQIFADSTVIRSGILRLSCTPHQTTTASIGTFLPPGSTASYFYLKLKILDKNHFQVYEKVFPLKVISGKSLVERIEPGKIKTNSVSGNEIISGNYRFGFDKATGNFQIKNSAGETMILDGPFARVGRKATVSEIAARKKANPKVVHNVWDPFILTKPETQIKNFGANLIDVNYKFKPESPKDRVLAGDISYSLSDSGNIKVKYHLAADAKEEATQTGLSFLIPASLTEFRWVGKGPYPAYPGKDRLSEFGIFHLNSNDLYFPGNRQKVSCAIFSDKKGSGFALVADSADITVERTDNGLVVSHNSSVSGHFNKYNWPTDLYSFNNGKPISGSFYVIPFTAETWPRTLKTIFGDIKQVAKPYAPFFYSYDQ